MPGWAVGVVEWAVGYLLKNLDSGVAKKALASALMSVDELVQSAEARVSGPFKGVADEVVASFHSSVEAICAALLA